MFRKSVKSIKSIKRFQRFLSSKIKATELNIPTMFYKDAIKPIYLDAQATTQTDYRVYQTMSDYFTYEYGNPHSRTHKFGWDAMDAVEKARAKIAAVINARTDEIIFTSGATESNNLAIKGLATYYKLQKKRNHIITLQTEHKCVLESCRYLSQNGYEITYLPVKSDGLVCLDALKAAIIPNKTLLVSIMAVHNEIGVIQPLKEIGALTRDNGAKFHTDAAQAFGKVAIDVDDMNIDMLSVSGHKIYGPKGIGALYVRKRVRLVPLIHGGGQERGFRSGTLPTPLIVGLGKAADLMVSDYKRDYRHIKSLRDRLLTRLTAGISHFEINGAIDDKTRYVGNLNISFQGVEGEGLLMACKELAMSSGSACTSASLEPSYVLKALNIKTELSHNSIRIGIGRFNTVEEIDTASDILITAILRLREISPVWEMFLEGEDLSSVKWNSKH